MMNKYLLKDGRVIDPANAIDEIIDVLIEGDKIAAVDKGLVNKEIAAGAAVIDASGKLVVPGLVDMHVHLRDPGRTDEETIESGLKAAARGGFTSIACM
ncbi:MAG TPA: amidohydrolase family protein, partial [Anaerolineae bacterium]|nr:amidohydrolase family protein [Anaerolineae bacterium]